MALLQDIEKAKNALISHRSNCDSRDVFNEVVRGMNDSKQMSSLMIKFLESLAKEVKEGGQQKLTKEQAKLFNQVQGDLASVSVYVMWLGAGKACDTFCKQHDGVVDALKRIQ